MRNITYKTISDLQTEIIDTLIDDCVSDNCLQQILLQAVTLLTRSSIADHTVSSQLWLAKKMPKTVFIICIIWWTIGHPIYCSVLCQNTVSKENFPLSIRNSLKIERSTFNILNCKCMNESANDTEHFGLQNIPDYSPKTWTNIKVVRIGDCESLALSFPTIVSQFSRVSVVIDNILNLTVNNFDIGSYSKGASDSSIIRKNAIFTKLFYSLISS